VVRAVDATDVAKAIVFGREHGIRTVPRSGGHCFAGRSSTDELLIDVTQLNQVEVSGQYATVGAGARLGAVYDVLDSEGRTLPAGTWPTVGIGGHVLGGGLGFLGRTHGLASDHLIAAEIVLADGQVVWCDERREADLFWALRGAGGGQFGVVTTFVFETVPTPATTTSYHLTWDYDQAAAVMASWQRCAPDAPDEYDVNLRLIAPADPDRAPELHLFGTMLGAGDPEVLTDIISAVGSQPRWLLHEQSPYLTAVRRLSGLGSDHSPEATAVRFTKSEFFRRPLPDAVTNDLAEQLVTSRTPGCVRELNFSPWGGAYNRVPADATAFAHRDEAFLLEHSVLIDDPTDQDARRWVNDAWQSTHPWGSGGVYPNFPDPDLTDWDSAYHGANLGRLRDIKRRYDPDNWFRFHQSVQPAEGPGSGA
jgi:FAD/FMN-containing dehydrogenase